MNPLTVCSLFCSAPQIGSFPISIHASQSNLSSSSVYALVLLCCHPFFVGPSWVSSPSKNGSSLMLNLSCCLVESLGRNVVESLRHPHWLWPSWHSHYHWSTLDHRGWHLIKQITCIGGFARQDHPWGRVNGESLNTCVALKSRGDTTRTVGTEFPIFGEPSRGDMEDRDVGRACPGRYRAGPMKI